MFYTVEADAIKDIVDLGTNAIGIGCLILLMKIHFGWSLNTNNEGQQPSEKANWKGIRGEIAFHLLCLKDFETDEITLVKIQSIIKKMLGIEYTPTQIRRRSDNIKRDTVDKVVDTIFKFIKFEIGNNGFRVKCPGFSITLIDNSVFLDKLKIQDRELGRLMLDYLEEIIVRYGNWDGCNEDVLTYLKHFINNSPLHYQPRRSFWHDIYNLFTFSINNQVLEKSYENENLASWFFNSNNCRDYYIEMIYDDNNTLIQIKVYRNDLNAALYWDWNNGCYINNTFINDKTTLEIIFDNLSHIMQCQKRLDYCSFILMRYKRFNPISPNNTNINNNSQRDIHWTNSTGNNNDIVNINSREVNIMNNTSYVLNDYDVLNEGIDNNEYIL